MKLAVLLGLGCIILGSVAHAQVGDSANFGRKNTYSVFLEYSNDSSHIILGSSPNRKLASLGIQYEHRLKSNRVLVWRYAAESRPLILESDPTETNTITILSPPPTGVFKGQPEVAFQCSAGLYSFSSIINGTLFSETELVQCGRPAISRRFPAAVVRLRRKGRAAAVRPRSPASPALRRQAARFRPSSRPGGRRRWRRCGPVPA